MHKKDSEYILELQNISKTFPGVRALDQVHFRLKTGEIHALMGENGAGKSTFIKVITGVHQPDEGSMYFEGRQVSFKNTRESHKAGIAAIYQHSTSYPHLSVTENIFLGHEELAPLTKRILWRSMHKKAQTLLDALSADFDARTVLGNLSVAQRQMVEIAKALSSKAKVIIMDEPTAALTKRESEQLYKITETLRDEGVGIIFISHRFEDMYRLASNVTVFRDSRYIGTWPVAEVTEKKLIVAMVGRELSELFPKRHAHIGDEVLSVRGLSSTGRCADVSFCVKEGEVLAFTGLVGAGRTEVFQALLGLTKHKSAQVLVCNKQVRIRDPFHAMDLGIGYLPEDRQLQGLILDWEIYKNISLSNMNKVSRYGFFRPQEEMTIANTLFKKVGVKARSVFDKASLLSGGNQQKVVFAKLLAQKLNVLILDEPTKGVDVAAKQAIYHIINELVSSGYAVILISSEMPEVLGMSDRIAVMREGRIVKTFVNDGSLTQDMILKASLSSVNSTSSKDDKNMRYENEIR